MVASSRDDNFDLHPEEQHRLEEIRLRRTRVTNYRAHLMQAEIVGYDEASYAPVYSVDGGLIRRGVEIPEDEDSFPMSGFLGLCIGSQNSDWNVFAK